MLLNSIITELGLMVISRKVINTHNTSKNVESTVGKSSLFSVTLMLIKQISETKHQFPFYCPKTISCNIFF